MKKSELQHINGRLNARFHGGVRAEDAGDYTRVTGSLERWEDIIAACRMAVSREMGRHVVNDIQWTGGQRAPMRVPQHTDRAIEGQSTDVLVIGGGISGAAILRELSKWKIDALLIDKESDLAMQASGRNDGEVHPGVDLGKGTIKQRYVVRGNRMFDSLCKNLSVPFKRCGQYVCLTKRWQYLPLRLFALQRKTVCGVSDTRIAGRRELKQKIPHIGDDARFALHNPMAGCVSPYLLTIACAENAVENGARVMLNTAALSMKVENGRIVSVATNRGTVYPRVVINAAGVFAEDVAQMAGDRFFSIHPRRGIDAILDKKAACLTNHVVTLKEMGGGKTHTKGGGVIPTVHGNLLVGPDAAEVPDRECFATNAEGLDTIFAKQKKALPGLNKRDVIAYFAGLRAATFEEDFIIEQGRRTHNLIHCAGIQSPGLTTAPAVAQDVAQMAVDMLKQEGPIQKNGAFNPVRRAKPVLSELPLAERARLISQNPDYGLIVCRCEEISRGEIIDALSSPIPVHTIDGIKRRIRPGMGRCQGGFCMPLVARIISEYDGVLVSEVKKAGENAVISFGGIKP